MSNVINHIHINIARFQKKEEYFASRGDKHIVL